MQKYTALLFALVVVAAVALIIGQRPEKGGAPTVVAEALRDGGPAPSAGTVARGDAGASADAGDGGEHVAAGGPAGSSGPSAEEGPGSPESLLSGTDAGITLIDGTTAPALAGAAPKSVVFGVILLQYKGAQGAPPNARSRDAALELAKEIAADAKTDFKAALAKGDKGSQENAGRMPRGMLEPAPEFVLFSLPKDGVSDPVDTPRGFWIVHRIE
jgi:hypothetical protein